MPYITLNLLSCDQNEDDPLLDTLVKGFKVVNKLRRYNLFFVYHFYDYLELDNIEKLLKETCERGISIINLERNEFEQIN